MPAREGSKPRAVQGTIFFGKRRQKGVSAFRKGGKRKACRERPRHKALTPEEEWSQDEALKTFIEIPLWGSVEGERRPKDHWRKALDDPLREKKPDKKASAKRGPKKSPQKRHILT